MEVRLGDVYFRVVMGEGKQANEKFTHFFFFFFKVNLEFLGINFCGRF